MEPGRPEVAIGDITSHRPPARGVIADSGATKGWAGARTLVATAPTISTVHSAAATATAGSTEDAAAGTDTVDWAFVFPAGKITISLHVVIPTVIQLSRSPPTGGIPIPIIKIATTAATVAGSSRIHNGSMPTRTVPETTACHHHAPCMRVIVSAAIRPSHCSTNYRWRSVVLRQPAAPSFATRAKATPARKITGE